MANEIITINTYEGLRENLGKELKRTAQGFVRIGYMLRYAKESNVLEGSGYSNVNEFAKAEFGIDSTMVSRFISINERFSVDGNTSQLLPQYENMGWSKLTEMLQLPDEINEEITDNFSKSEIKEIRKEIEEEEKITAFEVIAEEKPDPVKTGYDDSWPIEKKLMYQICKDYSNVWMKYFERKSNCLEASYNRTIEMLAPDNEAIYTVRIPGEGKYMLSIKTANTEQTIINARTMEKTSIANWDIDNILDELTIDTGLATAKAEYEALFGTSTENVEPVEQKKETHVMKPDVKVEEAQPEETETQEEPTSEEEVIENTAEPILDAPMEAPETDEEVSEETHEVIKAEDVEIIPAGVKDTAFLNLAKRQYEQLKRDMDMESYKKALETADKLVEYLKNALED